MSDNPVSSDHGQVGAGIIARVQAERAMLGRVPDNSRVCATCMNDSVRINRSRLKHCYLFVVSVYVPTDCSSSEATDEFYHQLSRLLRNACTVDIVVVAVGSNAQLGYLTETEGDIGRPFSASVDQTDNGDRLTQVCSLHRPLLAKA